MNKLIFISIISMLFISVYSLSGCTENSNNNVDSGEDFKFQGLDGSLLYLSDYRGKIVILDMWATWCSPCKYQMIELQEIYDSYTRDTLEILSIDVDPSETLQQIQDFILTSRSQDGIDLNWIFGKDNGKIWEKYMTNDGGIPTLCIFDQDGNLYFQDAGYKDATVISQKIDNLLS